MSAIDRALDEYLDRWGSFDWAHGHCGIFAGNWVRQITRRRTLDGLPTLGSAIAWMRRVQGLGGLQVIVTERMGVQPINPAMAQVGDIVMLPGPVTGGALGICCGRTAALLHPNCGIVHLPMAQAIHAWPLREVKP
jgi:hypothetical protein